MAMLASAFASRGRAVTLVLLLLLSLAPLAPTSASPTARSTTVWTGTVVLQDGYTVESGDVLVVQPGTTIQLGDDEDILVAGRITVQGTSTAPVLLESILGNHDGLSLIHI